MGKRLYVVLALGLLAGATSVALGDIAGSAHDFSSDSWSDGEICIVCHTPHNADTSITASPLWNHDVTSATFTLYDSPTLDETPLAPQGVSKLCLSCHDGTIALDSFSGMSGSNFVTGEANVGTDLSDDHPISIKWNHQTEIGACSGCHGAHQGQYNSALPFFDGYVECASCHDVHDRAGFTKLLRKSLAYSELCFHCHSK